MRMFAQDAALYRRARVDETNDAEALRRLKELEAGRPAGRRRRLTSTRQRRKVRVFASNVSAMSESEQNAPSAPPAVSDRGDREALGCVAALPPVTIDKLLRLAALRLEESEKRELEADLVKIIELVDALRQVDTTDVAPLAHPLESVQPLRPDRITESVERGRYQDGAPLVRDGLYLVPRVVS